MAVQNNLSYQDWLNQNGQGLMQAAGQQPVQQPVQPQQSAPQQSAPSVTQAVQQPAQKQAQVEQSPVEPTQEQQNPQEIYSKIGSMLGRGGSQPQSSPLRPSAYSNQPVS